MSAAKKEAAPKAEKANRKAPKAAKVKTAGAKVVDIKDAPEESAARKS